MSRYRPLCPPNMRNLREGHGSDNADPEPVAGTKVTCCDCHQQFHVEQMRDEHVCVQCAGRRHEHATNYPWA